MFVGAELRVARRLLLPPHELRAPRAGATGRGQVCLSTSHLYTRTANFRNFVLNFRNLTGYASTKYGSPGHGQATYGILFNFWWNFDLHTSSCSGLQTVFLMEHRPRIREDLNLHSDANC